MYTIIIPLLLIFTLSYSANVSQCPENEHFSRCASPCPVNCQKNVTLMCPAICLQGCICKEGYIRESEGGRCTRSCRDVPVCEENEQFVTCGSACPKICGDVGLKPCPFLCVKGCVCRNGYVRDRNGKKCVLEKQCAKRN